MTDLKMPTKEQILGASEDCAGANRIMRTLFPEAFEEEWEDVTEEITWKFRADIGAFGVLVIRHGEQFIGHLWADGEFYFTVKDYKRELKYRNFRILKKK